MRKKKKDPPPCGPRGPIAGLLADEQQSELDLAAANLAAITAALQAGDDVPYVRAYRALAYRKARADSEKVENGQQAALRFDERFGCYYLALATCGARLVGRLANGEGMPSDLTKYTLDQFTRQKRATYRTEKHRLIDGNDSQRQDERESRAESMPSDLTAAEQKEYMAARPVAASRKVRRTKRGPDYLDEDICLEDDASELLDELVEDEDEQQVLELLRDGHNSFREMEKVAGMKRHRFALAYNRIVERGRKSA